MRTRCEPRMELNQQENKEEANKEYAKVSKQARQTEASRREGFHPDRTLDSGSHHRHPGCGDHPERHHFHEHRQAERRQDRGGKREDGGAGVLTPTTTPMPSAGWPGTSATHLVTGIVRNWNLERDLYLRQLRPATYTTATCISASALEFTWDESGQTWKK